MIGHCLVNCEWINLKPELDIATRTFILMFHDNLSHLTDVKKKYAVQDGTSDLEFN